MSVRGRLKTLAASEAKWGLTTEIATLAISLITFVIIGPRLGPGTFGSLAAILSTIALVSPLVSASPDHVIVLRIARGMTVPEAWARATGVLVTTAIPAALLIVVTSIVVAPDVDALTVATITFAEMTFMSLARVAIRAHEARGANRSGAVIAVVTLATRAVTLGVFLAVESPSLPTWAALHLVGSVGAALFAARTLWRLVPEASRFEKATVEDFRTGLPFSLSSGPDGILSDNDKMVLSGSGLSVDAGIYAAAYRIASLGGLPSQSVLRTRYASNFRPENQSPEASMRNARSIVQVTLPAGLASCIGLVVLAPVASLILGDDFNDSVNALRYLAFLPLVRSVLTPGADALTGTGRHRTRIFGTLSAGLMNLALNLVFIPKYGWKAAIATTLIAELLLLLWIWLNLAASAVKARRWG